MAPFYIMTISAVAQYVGEFLQDTDKQIKTDRFVVSEIGQEYEGITSRPSSRQERYWPRRYSLFSFFYINCYLFVTFYSYYINKVEKGREFIQWRLSQL